ncbi:helix-turn-helix domain-containing protein [Methylorubrum thiocyanatum]|uniref:helix-turn-helix domain-containing protein n=1 Tax=Methylorubrum thiocyanatum TaxID=47958 RepID=UPI003F7DA1A1
MTDFGQRLIQAAHEAVAIARGEAEPNSYVVHRPLAIDVQLIRESLGLTQDAFAARYRVPVEIVRDLEQGRAQLDPAMQAYLTVISREPELVRRALETA